MCAAAHVAPCRISGHVRVCLHIRWMTQVIGELGKRLLTPWSVALAVGAPSPRLPVSLSNRTVTSLTHSLTRLTPRHRLHHLLQLYCRPARSSSHTTHTTHTALPPGCTLPVHTLYILRTAAPCTNTCALSASALVRLWAGGRAGGRIRGAPHRWMTPCQRSACQSSEPATHISSQLRLHRWVRTNGPCDVYGTHHVMHATHGCVWMQSVVHCER